MMENANHFIKFVYVKSSLQNTYYRKSLYRKITCCSYCKINNAGNSTKKFSEKKTLSNDWIGPPHAVSNLRPVKMYVPQDETCAERDYRLRREKVHKWNQKFWEAHNTSFISLKEQFVAQKLGTDKYNDDGTEKTIPAESLSEFYSKFLNENHQKHWNYNIEWYKSNFGLLWPALRAKLSRIKVKLLSKES